MKVYYYLEGKVIPLRYDYLMGMDGVLEEVDESRRVQPDALHILIQQGGSTISEAQRESIELVKESFGQYELHFYFPYE